MNAVQKAEPDNMPAIRQDEASLLAVIGKIATDPNSDIGKLERIADLYERLERKRASAEFDAAMAEMQPELPAIAERGNAAGRYTYALWEDVNTAIKPVLHKHGFALTFRTDFTNGITVTAVLSHRSGHREETAITLQADKSGNKNDVQAAASSVSYGKRYTAGALLNLTSHGEDDDAYQAGGGYDITDWCEAFKAATTSDELHKLGEQLKAATGIPGSAMRNLRSAYAKRAKELA